MRIRSFFSLFKLALSSEHQDYTQGSIRRAVFLLAVPMILEMCMESVFAVVDIFFVGRLGKNEAVSTVVLTESVLTIVYSMAIGLSMAARSEEHTSELQSQSNLVCRLLLEKKK